MIIGAYLRRCSAMLIQVLSFFEEENSLQRQLIERLREESDVLEKHAQKYLETMRKMLEDIHQ